MPNRIVIDSIGGPEVLKYEEYSLDDKLEDNNVRIKNCIIYCIDGCSSIWIS